MKNSISQLSHYSLCLTEMNSITGGVLTDSGSGSYAGVANGAIGG